MKKQLHKIVACVLAMWMFVCSVSISAAAETVKESVLDAKYAEYTTLYLEKIAGRLVTISSTETLYSCQTEQPIAILYTFNDGYAIMNMKGSYVCEYSLGEESPYAAVGAQKKYYDGPMGYYTKRNNIFTHTISGETVQAILEDPDNTLATTAVTIKDIEDKIVELRTYNVVSAKSVYQENSLPRALSTAYVNSYCGPTAAHAMLKYRGLVLSSQTEIQNIYSIATHTGSSVNLESLREGINKYIGQLGKSTRVASCGYSFSKVTTEINAGRPLTLGTNGGGLANGGHVQTIHGYERETIGTGSITYYTLKVNDSWGRNGRVLSYENTPPTYLRDHVYYTS